jgi:hypothetical protein
MSSTYLSARKVNVYIIIVVVYYLLDMAELTVPRILYQTWKTHTLPANLAVLQQKWLDLIQPSTGTINSTINNWQYKLLDDADLRNLVKDNFPQYLKSYDKFSKNIERVDFARCVMMYLGGVYADLDTYPVKSIDKFIDQSQIILGREPVEHATKLYDGRTVVLCNAFMISPPGQQLWINLMDYIIKNYEPNYKPVYNTGPMAMTLFMEANPDQFKNVIITDPCVFFPMMGNGKFSDRCIDTTTGQLTPQTYVVHQWENTWSVPWYRDRQWFNVRYWFWGLITIFTIMWLRDFNRK